MRKGSKEPFGSTKKTWSLEFFRTPIEAHEDASLGGERSVIFELNELDEQGRARSTGATERQRTDLIATSLGYHSDSFTTSSSEEENPWYDPILRRVRTSSHGRAMDSEGRRVANVYASGWAANGARGVIASSMYDAYDVADTIVSDYIATNDSPSLAQPTPSASTAPSTPFESAVFPMSSSLPENDLPDMYSYPDWMLEEIIAQGNKRVLTYNMWARVDAEEIRRGQKLGKERERMSWKEVDRLLAWEGQPAHPNSLV